MLTQDRFLLPLIYHTLVVEMTTRCNAKCGMCYQGAGPKGSDYLGDATMSVDEIKRILHSALTVPGLPKRFHMAGGEAFIKMDDCLEIFGHASSLGFHEISCTTNAFWAADMMKARGVARQLRDVGVTRMEISWDYWHGPYIPPQAINNCIAACDGNDIVSNLRLLTSRSHSAEEALSTLSPAALAKATMLVSAPVYRVGRGLELDEADVYGSGEAGTCHSALNLTINARGEVSPCCAGFDQTDHGLFGNVRDRDLAAIAEDINRSLLIRMVVFEGIGSLRPVLALLGEELKSSYSSICNMCFEIFADRQKVAKLVRFFESIEAGALEEALDDAGPQRGASSSLMETAA